MGGAAHVLFNLHIGVRWEAATRLINNPTSIGRMI
jgi:hypothetical protein